MLTIVLKKKEDIFHINIYLMVDSIKIKISS